MSHWQWFCSIEVNKRRGGREWRQTKVGAQTRGFGCVRKGDRHGDEKSVGGVRVRVSGRAGELFRGGELERATDVMRWGKGT
jgi:hypothetical protein